MAVGLLRPDQGNAWVAGNPVWPTAEADRAKQLLGVLPDGLALPRQLTGRELLTYVGLLRSIPAAVVAARIGELLRVLDLEAADATLIGDYLLWPAAQQMDSGNPQSPGRSGRARRRMGGHARMPGSPTAAVEGPAQHRAPGVIGRSRRAAAG